MTTTYTLYIEMYLLCLLKISRSNQCKKRVKLCFFFYFMHRIIMHLDLSPGVSHQQIDPKKIHKIIRIYNKICEKCSSFSLKNAYSRYIALISPQIHISFPISQYCTLYIYSEVSKIKPGF